MKPKPSRKKSPPTAFTPLKSWTAIAHYLGIPVATALRWPNEDMPVRRHGPFTMANREALNAWLGHESCTLVRLPP